MTGRSTRGDVSTASPLTATLHSAGAPRRSVEHGLLVRYHRDGDLAARDDVIERLMPFAHKLALRYARAGESIDDLQQVAYLGLVKAVDRFEPERGSEFISYAAPTILGELKRHFRDKGWVPRDLKERTLAVGREAEALGKELGRSPKVREIAAAGGWTREEVLEAQAAAAGYDAASLDAPTADGGGSGSIVGLLGGADPAYERVEERDAIASNWGALSELERKVVELRFLYDLTQREIGDRIGYSQMHVSRLLRRALDRLETAAAA
jgi:RNA polymerase sigma-B factor